MLCFDNFCFSVNLFLGTGVGKKIQPVSLSVFKLTMTQAYVRK